MHGTPHLNVRVRADYVDTETGIKRKETFIWISKYVNLPVTYHYHYHYQDHLSLAFRYI